MNKHEKDTINNGRMEYRKEDWKIGILE